MTELNCFAALPPVASASATTAETMQETIDRLLTNYNSDTNVRD